MNRTRRDVEQAAGEPSEDQKPEPIRVVERVLTRPDGTTVKVDVPVYPPFELKSHVARQSGSDRMRRKVSNG